MTELDCITSDGAVNTWGLGQVTAGRLAAFLFSSLALAGALAVSGNTTALDVGGAYQPTRFARSNFQHDQFADLVILIAFGSSR